VKRHAPATARNRDPILDVLRDVLPPSGTVLEIASGSGEHASYFAAALPNIRWQPTDPDRDALASIAAHAAEHPKGNLLAPLALDVLADWPVDDVAAIVCINMIHIAPWACCEALMRGAGHHLPSGGPLVTYGPYRFDGAFTAPSNETFDASLRHRNPEWGVRDLSDVTRVAAEQDLVRERVVALPANNHCVVFRRR
jgi:hypothetical protein